MISSVLFAVLHFNPSGFLIYLAVGCAFAYAYVRTTNLLAAIAAHATYNGLVLLAGTLMPGS